MNKRQLTKWREAYTIFDAPCLGEGLYLHVHFDEMDDVKRLGGRWNPDPSGKGGHWWMPKKQLDKDCPIGCEFVGDGWSGTIQDWLNNYKMIAGQYGVLNENRCHEAIQGILGVDGGESTVYQLVAPDGVKTTIEAHPDLGVVQVETHTGSSWMTMADARLYWDACVTAGCRKIISSESEVSA